MSTAPVDSAPAGGAATIDLLIGGAVSSLIILALLALAAGHRTGRITWLERLGDRIGARIGLPGWAAVPLALAVPAFASAGFGFVWDVAIHIDNGRDAGPFGTPAHFFMLGGIYGFFAAGWLAVTMPWGRGTLSWVRITRTWSAPAGALVMLLAASMALLGFPLDDLWHRLFGQDVTLWGPTHQMMINGGLFNFLGLVMLVREARLAQAAEEGTAVPDSPGWRAAGVGAAGIVLTGFTIAYQQEFAYGVPQFRLLFQPLLIALTGAAVLVAVRLSAGRGAALATAVAAVATLGLLTALVGPVAGQSTHHFPLYLAEAVIVELVALVLARRGGYAVGAVAGALIGSAGVVAEWGWSHVWMPIPWPGHVVGEAILRGVPVAVAGGILGAWVAGTLAPRPAPAIVGRRAWLAPAAALAVAVASLGTLLHATHPPLRATMALTEVDPGPKRTVDVTVRFAPARVVRDADWLVAFAWQGKEDTRVLSPLRRVADGVYRTTSPLPVYGTWKTAVRFSRGSAMESVLVYAPYDSAIPAPLVPARAHMTRTLVADHQFMQRERKPGVPAWLFGSASAAVAAIVIALLCWLGWATLRIARSLQPPPAGGGRRGTLASAAPPERALVEA